MLSHQALNDPSIVEDDNPVRELIHLAEDGGEPLGYIFVTTRSDYFTGDPDEEPLRWSVHDMRRKDFWGASVVPTWYTEATDVLDLDGQVAALRTIDMSTSEGAVGADGLR